MANKLQYYSDLAEQSTKRLTHSRENWTNYLTTAARLYKYPFDEQAMIFAQRPDAKACAALETWNKPMNRYIKRGSKGIALLQERGGKSTLKYVFDVSDTQDGRYNARRPYLWELQPQHQAPVMEALAKNYGDIEGDLETILHNIAESLATEYYENNRNDIGYSTDGSYLEDYDEYNVGVAFREALTVSVSYSLMSRCGLDTSEFFENEDFQCVFDFNTGDTVNALGTAVSEVSEQVLREIEVTIKNYERQQTAERGNEYGTHIYTERGLFDSRPDFEGTTAGGTRQIRADAPEPHQETPPHILQFPSNEREVVQPPVGNRPDSEPAVGTVDVAVVETELATRQSDRADGVGATHEQPEITGGRNDFGGTDLQLEQFNEETPSTMGWSQRTVAARPSVQGGVLLAQTLANTPFSLENVDTILRDGGNQNNSTMRIVAHYMKNKSPEETTDIIKNEYKTGGKGFEINGKRVAVWFDETGIRLGDGPSALHGFKSVSLTWEQVENRVRELIYSGNYMPQNVIDQIPAFERKELAQKLWYIHQDADSEFFIDESMFDGGFPDSTTRIAQLLSQPEKLANIIEGLEKFTAVYEQNRSVMRYHFHEPQVVLQRLVDLQITPLVFKANEIPIASHKPFITEDEITVYLTRGSNVSEGKFRIFSCFLHENSSKEKADFLKDEYGHGGGSHALSGADNSHSDSSSKGIVLSRGSLSKPSCNVILTWANVATRINELINTGNYMNSAEMSHLPSYERKMLGANVKNFFSNLPQDMPRPKSVEISLFGDYWDNAQEIGNTLDNPKTVLEILDAMKPVLESTHPDDRYYNTRKVAFENITAFQNGTFTLFPQLDFVENRHQTISQTTPTSPITAPRPAFEPTTTRAEQLSFFPTQQQQIETIQLAEEQENSAFSLPETIEPADIDVAIVAWNGDLESKTRVFAYMGENARARETANFLKNEFGGELPAFTITKGEMELALPWAKVQRRIAQLIDLGQFLTPNELAKSEQLPTQEVSDIQEEPVVESSRRPYAVGDTVYLERDKAFLIERIDTNNISLRDPSLFYPILRSESIENFERMLGENPLNSAFTVRQEPVQEEPPVNAFWEAYQNLTSEHPDAIIFLQMGAFYEVLGDKALVVAETLGINTLSRDIQGLQERVPMCGIPEHILGENVDKLTQSGHKVIVADMNAQFMGRIQMFQPQENVVETPVIQPTWEEPIPNTSAEITTPQPTQTPINFHITDDHLGEGGAKSKFATNVLAIQTLQTIESENRLATPDEQEILSRYVGWGGLPQAFDSENAVWTKEFTELSSLLSPEEYDSARASTLNAHYTSPVVIKAMYDTVERMGFKTGNILEPACGVGNFLGLLPENMQKSKLYGVELDSITGRIAKQLYQQANITISGFEKTTMPDSFFDVAIGNIPFGAYKISDKRYDKQNFLVHDYFFGKALDQVRPGGIVAFITSKGTLDKKNPEVRKYLAQRAELLGAVRLPNNAFLKNAGTEVTSDIIFFQKRDRLMDIEPDWVHLGMTDEGIAVNSYFAENPEMMLGTMSTETTQYGHDTTCKPFEDADLAEQLKTALSNIQGQITEAELDNLGEVADQSIPADPSVRNYSFTLIEDKVYFRENSLMYPVDQPATTLERVKGMIALRDCVHALIDYQLNEYSDVEIYDKQAELNTLYDAFTAKYGIVSSTANSRAFAGDTAYYLLSSLEILDENGQLERKAAMFTKRTIKQKTVITSVDTSSEALAVSISEKACVDLDFMQSLTGFEMDRLLDDLNGVIFKIPRQGEPKWAGRDAKDASLLAPATWVAADEYLSGNVRDKLQTAIYYAQQYPEFDINVKALEMAQPKDLDASEISVRLGATWIDKQYIQQFMNELLQPPYYMRDLTQVNFSEHTGEWNITGTGRIPLSNVLACVTHGTNRINAYKIIEDTLNLRDVRIYDTKIVDGKETRVLNKKETTLAQQKQEGIKQAFKDWVFKEPTRRQTLVALYNERFNSTRPREYDGSHINFSGINPEIKLKPHQSNAIAHILYGGNTLLAHEVGAGKTFEMVAAAMESKRLGLCQKSLFAVPNHLTEQTASEFLRLYPSANLLVATAKDFEMKNRRKFCAKIATGDYDAVIIGHSQLEKIPMSKERQERLLREQIDEITNGIDELKHNRGERFSIKQLEKTRKSLEVRLEKLTDGSRKDSVVTFEQLGVDRLFVDEAHAFKNLFLYTKMRNVAGLSQTEAQKSSDLFMKCRYLDELTDGKGLIYATGTPISNSMTELYTIQRYLQYDTLQRNNLIHFDAWASTFGETVTSVELAPEGNGYRARTRFAKFHNLPELMSMFKDVADIKTADMLDLPLPKANFHTVVVKPSELQQEMVADLSERAAAVHAGVVDPSVDNMLKITSDGRKIGLDQRLMNPMLPDHPDSKVNACMNNVFDTWLETQQDHSTQLVFCDFSTPNNDGRFNVYDDIKGKLLEKGIPESEIAFIHDATTETRKKELFAKVRKGQVRVLFGSTFKMGSGTNVQDRLVKIHDLDCPWRPSDLEQRRGRIVRQGNLNPEVSIVRYVTESTFDSYMFQTIENKQKFIGQIMSSKSPVRSCEDVDEAALSYAEIKALCAGDDRIKEKMGLDIEVARLRLLKADHQSQHYRLEDNLLKSFPESIERTKEHIKGFESDISRLEASTHKSEEGISPMVVHGISHTDRGMAGAAIIEACKQIKSKDPVNIGTYRGFDMQLSFDSFNKAYNISLKGAMSYSTDLSTDTFGNITRINNALGTMPQRLLSSQTQLDNVYQQVENAKTELQNPFSLETELAEKSERLTFLNAELNIDGGKDEQTEQSEQSTADVAVAKQDRAASSAKSKPSILESLRAGTAAFQDKASEKALGKPDKDKSNERGL